MTPLDKVLRRSIPIDGAEYVVTLSPDSLKITQKGHRLGVELAWKDLVSGEGALAVALQASVGKFQTPAPPTKQSVRAARKKTVAGGKRAKTPARVRR